jgi:hypothetical protein
LVVGVLLVVIVMGRVEDELYVLEEGVDSGGVDLESVDSASDSNVYLLYTLNTQEFMTPDLSYQTVNQLLDLHEAYEVPIDVYFADFLVQALADDYGDLFDRLKREALFAVSYHVRAPFPYGGNYNPYDWDDFSSEALYSLIESYESFAMDWVTGELTDDAGGYTYLADLMGYPPVAAGVKNDMPEEVKEALVSFYADAGASFVVSHKSGDLNWGDMIYELPYRPENLEIKVYNQSSQATIDEIESFLAKNEGSEEALVINLKMHDKDFFADDSAWVSIYGYGNPKPPYKLERYDGVELLPIEAQEEVWNTYEAVLEYVSETEALVPVNLSMLDI